MNLIAKGLGFNINRIEKNQFCISLIKECIKAKFIDENIAYSVQIQLAQILKEKIMKFTKGQSASVTVETAEQLLIAIWYTIDTYVSSFDKIEESIEVIKNESLEQMYKNGKIIIQEELESTSKLYEDILKNKFENEVIAYNDTLIDGIKPFFKLYDVEFEPHEVPANIDYPLAFDDWDIRGICYIKNYLWNINIENKICSYFENDSIQLILERYGEMYQINYRDLLINIFELAITNAVFSVMVNQNSKQLEIDESQFRYIEKNIKNLKSKKDVESLIDLCIQKVIIDLDITNEDEIEYIKQYKKVIIRSVLLALKNNNLKNMLVVSKDIKVINQRFIIDEDNKLDNDTFRELIEEIRIADSSSEKITIIKTKINSIKDFIDVLKSDCLFGNQYIDLYKSLTELELSILGKLIFSEECRMNKLNLNKVDLNNFEINYDWEKYYIKYIGNLDKNRIIQIEDKINIMGK